MADRPPGKGLGACPAEPSTPRVGRPSMGYQCWCGEKCAACGYPKHAAIHRHVHGERPGDPPFGHEFVPRGVSGKDYQTFCPSPTDGKDGPCS